SVVGGNFRLDALQAALLAVKLPHLAAYTAARQENSREYTRGLQGLPGKESVEIVLPAVLPGRTHIVNQYTLRVRRGPKWQWKESPREALSRWLREREIASEIYYPVPLHMQECFQEPGLRRVLPVAEELSSEVISLPIFPELTAEERNTVVE